MSTGFYCLVSFCTGLLTSDGDQSSRAEDARQGVQDCSSGRNHLYLFGLADQMGLAADLYSQQ